MLNVHPIVQQRERGVGVPQTVQRSVLPGAWAGDQARLSDESAKRLMQVL